MSRWPVAGPSDYWLLASSPASEVKNSNAHTVQEIHKRQQHPHKTTTTIHTANQQQLHTRQLKTSNNTRETNQNTTCTKATNTQARQHCVQFLVIVFSETLIHSRFHPSLSLLTPIKLFHQETPHPPQPEDRSDPAAEVCCFMYGIHNDWKE